MPGSIRISRAALIRVGVSRLKCHVLESERGDKNAGLRASIRLGRGQACNPMRTVQCSKRPLTDRMERGPSKGIYSNFRWSWKLAIATCLGESPEGFKASPEGVDGPGLMI
jgi:hypothetical protein